MRGRGRGLGGAGAENDGRHEDERKALQTEFHDSPSLLTNETILYRRGGRNERTAIH
jgi:hypothetical protein